MAAMRAIRGGGQGADAGQIFGERQKQGAQSLPLCIKGGKIHIRKHLKRPIKCGKAQNRRGATGKAVNALGGLIAGAKIEWCLMAHPAR